MTDIDDARATPRARTALPVTWGDCDASGMVFYPRYYAWFDRCTHRLLDALGLDHHRLRREFGVIGAPLVQASARFRSPATFGDTLTATSWIAEVGRRSFTVRHELVVDARLVVEGEETRVWGVGCPDDPKQLRAETIPSEIRALLLGDEAPHATDPGEAP